jgi:hypothetical protein
VLAGGDIPDLVECVDVNSVRVHAPTSVILVCGGRSDVTATKPTSLRDAYVKLLHRKEFSKYKTLLAEELQAFFPNGQYRDILTLEADIAQISDLIILFTESFGSAAELGAFAIMPTIAPKLLVVIDDHYYGEDSFIKLGSLT